MDPRTKCLNARCCDKSSVKNPGAIPLSPLTLMTLRYFMSHKSYLPNNDMGKTIKRFMSEFEKCSQFLRQQDGISCVSGIAAVEQMSSILSKSNHCSSILLF